MGSSYEEPAEITWQRVFHMIVKSGYENIWIFKEALNLTLFAWKLSWWRTENKIFMKGVCTRNCKWTDFTFRVSKSCVPLTCKFSIVMHFVPILHRRCRSKTFSVLVTTKLVKNFVKVSDFPLHYSRRNSKKKTPLSEPCENDNRSNIVTILYNFFCNIVTWTFYLLQRRSLRNRFTETPFAETASFEGKDTRNKVVVIFCSKNSRGHEVQMVIVMVTLTKTNPYQP